MPLGGSKDEHFSCFYSSCQLGLSLVLLVIQLTIGLTKILLGGSLMRFEWQKGLGYRKDRNVDRILLLYPPNFWTYHRCTLGILSVNLVNYGVRISELSSKKEIINVRKSKKQNELSSILLKNKQRDFAIYTLQYIRNSTIFYLIKMKYVLT